MRSAFSETGRPRAMRRDEMPAHKRHEAIVEAMSGVAGSTEARISVASALQMALKDADEIKALLAEADESEGWQWQLELHYDADGTSPHRVVLVVLGVPTRALPVRRVDTPISSC